MKRLILCMCCLLPLMTGCGNSRRPGHAQTSSTDTLQVKLTVRHARGFSLTYTSYGCLLDLKDPSQDEGTSFHYALIPKGTHPDQIPAGYTVIPIPVSRIVCMTSLQLSNFIKLEALDAVTGITSTRHLFNEEVRQRITDGRIRQIGIEGNFDQEVIIRVNPELMLVSPSKRGGYDVLRQIGIPLLPHLGYQETSPLGQTEWIKVAGLLLGMETQADHLFTEIERRYTELAGRTRQITHRPTVFSGELQGGNWYAVGGQSFLAAIFRDAGADYFLKDDLHTGGFTMDYETVYSQAANADYWRIVNSYPGDFTYQVLGQEDVRYSDFRAFREIGVF